ncbi:8507_t:CDS:2, partial [Gigaspora margarita]
STVVDIKTATAVVSATIDNVGSTIIEITAAVNNVGSTFDIKKTAIIASNNIGVSAFDNVGVGAFEGITDLDIANLGISTFKNTANLIFIRFLQGLFLS